jgi:hypothetical protein
MAILEKWHKSAKNGAASFVVRWRLLSCLVVQMGVKLFFPYCPGTGHGAKVGTRDRSLQIRFPIRRRKEWPSMTYSREREIGFAGN